MSFISYGVCTHLKSHNEMLQMRYYNNYIEKMKNICVGPDLDPNCLTL